MERLTLRDAAERTSRSVTTLRRYIRSGRLRAEKAHGRYGPEYLIDDEALAAAGLRADALVPTSAGAPMLAPAYDPALRESVPAGMYQELQMKHEQLLVQYGMVRAGGLRLMELRGQIEDRERRLGLAEADGAASKERATRETSVLRKRLRETELELEGRTLEVAALREKLRTLERIHPAPTPASPIERQIADVVEQRRRVEQLQTRIGDAAALTPKDPRPIGDPTDH